MAKKDIRIDDEYFNAMGIFYSKEYGELQDGVDKYIKIMESIIEDAIIEGKTAKALESFVNYAKVLSGIIKPLGEECKGLCINYLSEIDEADSFLY